MRVGAVVVWLVITGVACSRSEAPPAAKARPPAPTPHQPAASLMPDASARFLARPADATEARVTGKLEKDTGAQFVIAGQKGTLLLAHGVTPERDLDVSVYRGDTGERLADERPANPAFFVAHLPETLGYLIAVHAAEGSTDYALEVEWPRVLYFDDRTSAAEVRVAAPAHSVNAYVLPPSASFSVELSGPEGAFLTVQGLGGQPLLKAEQGARSFAGAANDLKDAVIVRLHQGPTDGDLTLKAQRK